MAEILSQEEIDALLEVVDDNTDTPIASNSKDEKDERNIVVYDFKRPNRVSKEQLRTIKGIHDKLARNLASQISSMMRSIVETKLHSVDQMTYGEFLMSLPSPTSFNVFFYQTFRWKLCFRNQSKHSFSYDRQAFRWSRR